MRLPPAVIWMRLGSALWERWSSTTLAYGTMQSWGYVLWGPDRHCIGPFLSCFIVALTHAAKIFPECSHPNFHSVVVVHEVLVATD